MAIFESPNTPDPVPHGEQRAPLISSPYAALQHHELLQLIDELAEERARARFREGIWLALFAHLIFFTLLYFAPRLLYHTPKLIDPSIAMRDRKDIFLNPDVARELSQNHPQPKPPVRRQLDQKTLQQLQQMQQQADQERALERALQEQQRAKQQQQQQPQQPQQQANNTPSTPPPPPANNPALPLPEAPKTQSNALPDMAAAHQQASSNADNSFNNTIKQLSHKAIQGNANHTYTGGANVAPGSRGVGSGMQILSDTMGVDFDPYMSRLKLIIENAWRPLIPESVYPPLLKQGVVGIRFTIAKDGKLSNIVLETPSGDVALDKAAWGAVTSPQPFPPLPKEFPGKSLEIRGGFFYNIPPTQ